MWNKGTHARIRSQPITGLPFPSSGSIMATAFRKDSMSSAMAPLCVIGKKALSGPNIFLRVRQ
jgi:hypothetical protein